MSLDSLPSELLLKIFSKLPEEIEYLNFDTREVQALALTSRRFHDLATPILYSSFNSQGNYISRFLRSLLRRPQLATYVKSAMFMFQLQDRKECDEMKTPEFTEEEWSLFRDAIVGVYRDGEHAEKMIMSAQRGRWDVLVSVLLPKLVSLTSLAILDHYDWSKVAPYYFTRVTEQSADFRVDGRCDIVLPKLENLDISLWQFGGNVDLFAVIDFLKLPSLTSFDSCYMLCLNWEDEAPEVFSIKQIILHASIFDDASLGTLISCCPQLESLFFELALDRRALVRPDRLGRRLKGVESTLKNLEMFGFESYKPELCTTLGSLANFQVLHNLVVPASMVVGSAEHGTEEKIDGKLPKSLVSLKLYDCERTVWREIETLIAEKRNRSLAIELIDLEFMEGQYARRRHEGNDESTEEISYEKLQDPYEIGVWRRCPEVGITLDIRFLEY